MARRHTVLIVDDHETTRETLAEIVRGEGHRPLLAATGEEGLKHLAEEDIDIVLTDLRLPDLDGLDLLKKAQAEHPETPVVLITGHGNEEVAVSAMRLGAQGYLAKPLDLNRLRAELEGAVKVRELHLERQRLRRRLEEAQAFGEMVGASAKMREVFAAIRRVAPTDATILIEGESGTGKELVADAICAASGRKEQPFIKVAVAALSHGLLESELFGHERGAFTGAVRQKKGRFELADGGTLFLDEIGEMPPETQLKLLRVLDQRSFERVGGTETIHTDIRLVSATNQDLALAVAEGRFRQDLYFRINVITIRLPPLRERREDVALLYQHFMRLFERTGRGKSRGITPAALEALGAYRWPGNVRELRNVVERLCITCPKETIDVACLPEEMRPGAAARVAGGAVEHGRLGRAPAEPDEATIEELERETIRRRLAALGGNKTQTAKSLGIGLKTLYRKLERYGIK